MDADLRDDRQYLIDHPGATLITTAQASNLHIFLDPFACSHLKLMIINLVQGQELKKTIGAAVYIECSSKTQQVWMIN